MIQSRERPSATPLLLGLIAVLLFSGTAAGTRSASLGFGGDLAGCARVLLGGMLAVALLLIVRPPWPSRRQWLALVPVIVGCGMGFPLLLSRALASTGASHAAVALGLIPLATTLLGSIWAGERLPLRTLAATAVGTIAVVAEAWSAGSSRWSGADALLGSAVLLAALGYVGGARLAKTMPGWQVICWGTAAALPVTLVWAALVTSALPDPVGRIAAAPLSAWLGLAWIGSISQILGFVPWYAALARGGIARVGQMQLLQPGLSVLAAWICIGESPRTGTIVALTVVILALALNPRRRAAVPSRAVLPLRASEAPPARHDFSRIRSQP